MKEQGFKLISVWECEKPVLKNMIFEKEFRPYPNFIVYDFEALHKKINESQTEELAITSKHVPVSVAINDNLTNEPVFIVDQDPENLIKSFVEDLHERQEKLRKWLSLCIHNQKVMKVVKVRKRRRKILFGEIGLIKFLFLALIREGLTLT